LFFCFQAEDGIRDLVRSRGLGDVYKRQALSEADMDPAVVEKEKQVQMDIARESGKPEQVIEKMIIGRMKKFVAESTLLNQQFVVNPDLTVGDAAKDAGASITGFVRLEVGEGIEVE